MYKMHMDKRTLIHNNGQTKKMLNISLFNFTYYQACNTVTQHEAWKFCLKQVTYSIVLRTPSELLISHEAIYP